MTEVTSWWWVRHAPVTSAGGRIYGQQDLPADCSDGASFDWLAKTLPSEALWVTSHLLRTHQTARAILDAGHPGPAEPQSEPLVEPELAEQHFGDWQGLTHDEVSQRWDEGWHRFWVAPAAEAPPGGESFAQVVERVAAAVEEMNRRHAGRDIVAVTHGGTIRAALALALGLPAEQALAFSVANCSLTRLELVGTGSEAGEENAAWRVICVNQMAD